MHWSLILNVLLLLGVLVTIGLLIKARKQSLNPERIKPSIGSKESSPYDAQNFNDDIIAVRKVNHEAPITTANSSKPQPPKTGYTSVTPRLMMNDITTKEPQVQTEPASTFGAAVSQESSTCSSLKASAHPDSVMMFLLAKENRQFAGYELLQTVLTCGLRFGEGHLFHRHQFPNGQGPVLCSLAAATATGVFDLQNIGAFSVRGLCLYMHTSKNPGIDKERFSIMLDTAQQLSEGLDAHLLDSRRKPLTDESIAKYWELLQLDETCYGEQFTSEQG